MSVEAPTADEEGQFFEPGILTVTRQWHLIYKKQFRLFLEEFNRPEAINDNGVMWSQYEQAAIDVARFAINTLMINLQDIVTWTEGTELAAFLQQNYLTLSKAVDEAIDEFVKDVLRRYLAQHHHHGRNDDADDATHGGDDYYMIRDAAAASGHKTFYCTMMSEERAMTVRDLRCELIGQIINLRGTATRLSDIRPELKCATFRCIACQEHVPDVEQQFKFTEPQKCLRRECKNRNAWELKSETCQFGDWQKLRLQENSSEIPAGSMPRAIDVILTRRLCDRCKPGDKVNISGCLAAIPDVPSLMKPGDIPRSVAIDRNRAMRSEYGMADNAVAGLKKIGARDLNYRLVFIAQDVRSSSPSSELEEENRASDGGRKNGEIDDEETAAECRRIQNLDRAMTILGLTPEEQDLFLRISRSNDTLDKLAKCMAPEVFGCENIKKGILLMIVGGVEKITGRDNLKLRGDINICIVGDPGTAKSQLLKYVRQFAPRSVYTSGNTSTAAGLTVSITRDPDQGDAVIEAGALMLADKGICCIDEFDKMNIKDMIAIHEAMEQQTISICKGGVQATLNARASILAACNPRNSRYDLSKPFRHNVRLSAPIISRFDLFFVMLDHTQHDDGIAWHIVNLHADPSAPIVGSHGMLNRELLRKYLMLARSRRPKLTMPARNLLVRSYVGLRAETLQPGGAKSARVTVRSLESLIRLSEGIAKMKFAEEVTSTHVEEAIRLMQSSLLKLERDTITLDDSGPSMNDDDGEGDEDMGGGGHDDDGEPRHHHHHHQGITLNADEFERITSTLINKLRDEELEFATAVEEARQQGQQLMEPIVLKDTLITWYLENFRDPSVEQTAEVMQEEYDKIERVINRMVSHDMSFIEETREVESPSPDGLTMQTETVTTLRLHPNYCADASTTKMNGDLGSTAHHATLPTSFFAQAQAPEFAPARQPNDNETIAQHESYIINDDDFLAEMYGWQ